jgi:PAS domain S-box-containing protein
MIQLVEFMPSEYLPIYRKKRNGRIQSRSDKFFTMSSEMMIIASSTHFIKINPAAIKILGYTEEELLEQPFLNFVYPEDKNNTKSEIVKLETRLPRPSLRVYR